jgi:hypothetical protein
LRRISVKPVVVIEFSGVTLSARGEDLLGDNGDVCLAMVSASVTEFNRDGLVKDRLTWRVEPPAATAESTKVTLASEGSPFGCLCKLLGKNTEFTSFCLSRIVIS